MNKIFSNTIFDKYLFDSWSLVHLSSSFILFNIINIFVKNKLFCCLITFILGIIWELFENSKYGICEAQEIHKFIDYFGDSTINIIGDVISNFLGIYLGYKISKLPIIEKYFFIIIIFALFEIIMYNLSKITIINILITTLKTYFF